MSQIDNSFKQNSSHYLNEQNRLFPQSGPDEWGKVDADYNIRTGNTFGESEEITLDRQGWRSKE